MLTKMYCYELVTGNPISALGTTAMSQAVATNEYLTSVLLHHSAGNGTQSHRALSAVETRDLAVIRQSCADNRLKMKSRKNLCNRLQKLAWTTAVRSIDARLL